MGSEFQKQGRRVAQESLNSTDGGGLFPRLQQRYSLRDNPLEMETPFFPDAMRQHALETLRQLCRCPDCVTKAIATRRSTLEQPRPPQEKHLE